MVVEVYGMALSAPCRMVYMACESLGIEYKKINVDLMKGEHMVRTCHTIFEVYTQPFDLIKGIDARGFNPNFLF